MTRRCAILGVGLAGNMQVRAMKEVTAGQLVAVADHDHAKAAESLAKNGVNVPIRHDLDELIKQDKPDVLHIAIPSGDHLKVATEAMERGLDVIIEKPLDITLDKIDTLLATAKKTGRKVAGIFQNRYNPANRLLKKAVDDGRFGNITWAGAFVMWLREPKYYQSWRGTWAMDGGGAIMNNSIHSVDLLQWLIGPVESVSAYAAARAHPTLEVEDTLTCSLKFKNGVLGTIVGSTGMFPGQPARIEIRSFNGMAVSEGPIKEFKFREPRPEDEDALKPQPQVDFQAANIQQILTSWAAGKEPETNGPECRKAVQIVRAMYASAAKGGVPVKVEEQTQ